MKNDFSSIGEVISDSLSSNPRYKYAIKCSTLFSFWDKIVGPKFAKFSKPVVLNFNKLNVSCKNPVVAQELTMFKGDLIKKIEKFASPLGLKVDDFIFNYKNWSEEDALINGEDSEFIEFSEEELSKIKLPQNEIEEVWKNIDLMPVASEFKEKYFNNIVNSIKSQKLRI